MRTALGLRAHSGWAAMVVVAGTLDAPQLLERRRIEIVDTHVAGSKQPYHAAVGLPLVEAETLVRKAIESSRVLALREISSTIKALRAQGHEVAGFGLLAGSGRPLPCLERIIASHPLRHTAEGEMFREVLMWAAGECHLSVIAVRENAIDAAWLTRMDCLSKRVGPPWTQDQKYATVAALLSLAKS